MILEIISTPPASDTFTSLAAHQERTPQVFFGGKPVLHFEDQHTTVTVPSQHVHKLPIYPSLGQRDGGSGDDPVGGASNGESNGRNDADVIISDIALWVTSEKVTLYNHALSRGFSLQYPSIILHAIQRSYDFEFGQASIRRQNQQSLYMEVLVGSRPAQDLEDYGDDAGDDDEILRLKIIPSGIPADDASQHATRPLDDARAHTDAGAEDGLDAETGVSASSTSPLQNLFTAISTCSNLHPDPLGDDDDENNDGSGGDRIMFEGSVGYDSAIVPTAGAETAETGTSALPPPFPGSSGWITAENVDDFFDEDGNWLGGQAEQDQHRDTDTRTVLGPGAGTVRTRRQEDGDGDSEDAPSGERSMGTGDSTIANGQDDDRGDSTSDTKWRRTS